MTTRNGLFGWYFGTSLLLRIIVALVAGVVVGIGLTFGSPEVAKQFVSSTAFFGDVFIRLLKMIVVPVIAFSLITGAAGITPSRLGRVGIWVLFYYIVTSAVSVVLGLGFAALTNPGAGMNIIGSAAAVAKSASAPSMITILLNVVPTNIFESLAKGDILPIIFFAMVFGIALSYAKDSSDKAVARGAEMLFDITSAAAEVMYKIVGGIMQYAPIGVFVLISSVFAQQGPKAVGPLLLTTLTFYAALVVLLIVGYGLLLGAFGLNIVTFLKGAREAMITAFVTRSSNGTLPVSLRVCEENLGVPRSIASFSLPLGATINMNGTAIYLGICAVFISNAVGMPLNFNQQIMVVMTATLAAIGTAGVPGSGAIMLLMVLDSVGLKIDAGSAAAAAYAMILGIDALLDMGRTWINVTGDIMVSAVVAKQEGELDATVWQQQPARA